MKNEDDVTIFPLAGYDLRKISEHQAILLNVHFLTSPLDAEPQVSPAFALSPALCRELAQSLMLAADQVESKQTPIPPDMKN